MKTKDQLNQNPVDVKNSSQEENPKSVANTDKNLEEKTKQPVENQEINSKKTTTKKKDDEKKSSSKKVVKKAEKKPATSKKTETKSSGKDDISKEEKKEEPIKKKRTTKTTASKSEGKATKKDKDSVKEDKATPAKSKKTSKTKETVPIKEDGGVVEEAKDKKKVKKDVEQKKEEEASEVKDQTKSEKTEDKVDQKEVLENKDDTEELDEDHESEELSETHEEVENLNKLSREELVLLLEETIGEGEINAIKKKVALIKVAFLKINKEEKDKKLEDFIASGGDKKEYDSSIDELEQRFNKSFGIYKQKRQIFLEEQEKQKIKNLEAKKIILEELKALIDSEESLKKTYDEFRSLQEKWKGLGMVPKSEVNNLWQSYHFYVERFFDKVKINKELRDLDLKKNLELKIELCEKAEELLIETSILKSFKLLQHYHNKWKEIGPVPQDKKDESLLLR